MLGSLEFCTSTLGTRLILVLGHTQCSAVRGATKMSFETQGASKRRRETMEIGRFRPFSGQKSASASF